MQSFEQALRIFAADNAQTYADELFREAFNAPFPVPRDPCGLSIPTPPENWRQYVAVYTWPEGHEETVGFCNWIKYDEAYLEGGLCVRANFYRRLSREHFRECQAQGGIAQMLMMRAAQVLNDCDAWFGWCGDPKALAVDLRAGFQTTDHKYLIVKWFRELPESRKAALIEKYTAIGPF